MTPANPVPPASPRRRKPGNGLIGVGAAFIAIGAGSPTLRAFLAVGVVFIIVGLRRNRANKAE